MLKIIKERTPEIVINRYIEFLYKDNKNAGFMFHALLTGEPDFEHMPPEAKANYEKCLTDDHLEAPEFIENKDTYMSPAIGECICGKEVVLEGGYEGAIQCECGRWYNLFGQSLIDPKYWYGDEDDYCFMSETEDL